MTRPEDARLTLNLFGAFEARVGDAPLPRLRTRKARWLLALLALRSGSVVERARLAGVLWPDSSEAMSLANLRSVLMDLRRSLGAAADCLRCPTTRTLSFDPADTLVDLIEFDAAIARSDSASLQQAVALYRGPLLEDCAEEWIVSERERREQAYLRALETLAAQSQEKGDHPASERWLRQMVAVDPLREDGQRALMRALAGGGNHAAALQVYRDLRILLHREINAGPDPATEALYRQIRSESLRQAQVWSATAHAPRPARSKLRHNLPLQLTRFIGREKELESLKVLLLRPPQIRLITLTGTGGTGKTRLALQAAEELLNDFPEGVFLVDLAPVHDPALVAPTIAQALGVREAEGQALLDGLKAYLRPRQLLLLLDNFEQVVETAPLVAELLGAAPQLQMLVTSRMRLHVRGEQEFPVSPLATDAAVELFMQRARAVQPEFAVTAENASVLAEICRRLEGLPLAIELAVERLKLFPPRVLLSRLEARLGLLTGGARDMPARQRTLRDTIAWSHDLLSPEEQALFRRLSVFTGGFTIEAAEAVGAEVNAFDLLAALVEKSLIIPKGDEGEPRFGMLETIREFGQERLSASEEEAAIRREHARFYLMLAERAEPGFRGADEGRWLTRFEMEHDNLRAALEWSVEAGETESGLRLGGAIHRFWVQRGYWAEGRQRLNGLLALAGAPAPPPVRAKALHAMGMLAFCQGDNDQAQRHFEEGLAICQELGDLPGVASSLHGLGNVAIERGDYARASSLFEESVAIRRTLNDGWGTAESLNNLAGIAYRLGDAEAARALYKECLTIDRETGDRIGFARRICNLGNLDVWNGDYEAARGRFQEGMAIFRELGDKKGIAGGLDSLASLALHQEGDLAKVRSLQEECLALRRELGDKNNIVGPLWFLGEVAWMQEEYPRARALLEESLAISREVGSKGATAVSLNELGKLAYSQGDYAEARARLEESLAIPRELYDKPVIAITLEELAKTVGAQGEGIRSARLFGAAEALRDALGHARDPSSRADEERAVAAVRAALGEEAFAAAWEEGRALSLEEAIAVALAPDETDRG